MLPSQPVSLDKAEEEDEPPSLLELAQARFRDEEEPAPEVLPPDAPGQADDVQAFGPDVESPPQPFSSRPSSVTATAAGRGMPVIVSAHTRSRIVTASVSASLRASYRRPPALRVTGGSGRAVRACRRR